jgi:hypothetical protein
MRKNAPVLVLGLLLLAAASLPLRALEVPRLEGRVNDYARILKPAEKSELESFLASVEQKTTAQLVLLTIPSLEGEPLEEYSMRVAETWKIGQKGQDNGVIMLVALEDRAVRIEVGYGLEPILPDGKCGTIIRQAIIPEFRGGNYFGGIQAGFQTMAQVIQGDTAGFDELQKQDKSRGKSSGSFCLHHRYLYPLFDSEVDLSLPPFPDLHRPRGRLDERRRKRRLLQRRRRRVQRGRGRLQRRRRQFRRRRRLGPLVIGRSGAPTLFLSAARSGDGPGRDGLAPLRA